MTSTLSETVVAALRAQSKGNSHTAAQAAAVLWTDKERQWQAALPALKKLMPGLCELGPYDPERRSGPAIWLKCAIAGLLPEMQFDGVPVIYLPGVSRADLRAIESCPRDLQPLAELQYRGVFWSQVNGKDWTVNAFLSSKTGGLGLSVAQDKATQEALMRALQGGVLLEQAVETLQGRDINAAWLDELLAPNPERDLLVWMNDAVAAKAQWQGGRWDVFASRCKKDYNFDPVDDGAIAAAERLAARQGAWSTVWELYRDAYAGFPGVAAMLAKLPLPQAQVGLFNDDSERLAGFPRANEEAEGALRYKLAACGAMAPQQARSELLALEKEHGHRRSWLWARMGDAPLARALQPLVELATLSAQLPNGSTLEQMAAKYQDGGWRVDQAALQALAAVSSKADTQAVSAALRAVYVPWPQDAAQQFQHLVREQGRLSALKGLPADAPVDGVCTVFVDGLRYDVAQQLAQRLSGLGAVTTKAAWTCMPSVTASGKAWASPVAAAVAGQKDQTEFQPGVAVDGKPLSAQNFRGLLEGQGWQVLDKQETGDPTGRAWVEHGDLDHYGHDYGLRLARDLDHQLQQVVERLEGLREAGWLRFRIVTDHGWLLVPGGLPKTELSKFEAETRWGRCAVLKDTSHGTALTFGWDWCSDVQIAFAPGIGSFIAGAEYAHGGLTLQECLVPILEVTAAAAAGTSVKADITKVTWTGLRCKVEVVSDAPGLRVDIRTKAALPESSLLIQPKSLDGGKASLPVADDANEGVAALVVVLDASGNVLQKKATTVGE